jgi:two-component system, chemotaxis family, protein-glutamate methylesterase/glutaminase
MRDDQPASLTGYTCPTCGGMLSQRTNGNGSDEYQCRIGHAFTPAQVWIEHCAMRNRALGAAARALAENADLARALAAEAKALGNGALAARLEAEAQSEERHIGQILEMLEEIGAGESEADPEHDR